MASTQNFIEEFDLPLLPFFYYLLEHVSSGISKYAR